MAQKTNAKIRYAVVGLGHIAQEAVLPAFAQAKKNSVLTALVTGHSKKAKSLSKQFNVEAVLGYEDYDNLLKQCLVDAVYIALPNHMHFEYAMKAIATGVHVLCEKPLVLTLKEAQKLEQAATDHKVKFMTAYRLHFEPANLKAIEICRKGDLGDLRYFSSDFSFQLKDQKNIRLDAEKGGGTLWDIGVYCINAVRNLFEDEPTEVFAFKAASSDPRFAEVEEMVSATLKFPNERLATFNCSFGAAATARFQVYGTKGSLVLENAFEYKESRKLTVTINNKEKTSEFKKVDQFAPELIYFSDCILNNKKVEPSIDEGTRDLRVILALYESIRKGRPVSLKEVGPKTQRPNEKMQMRLKAPRKPKEVQVTPPH